MARYVCASQIPFLLPHILTVSRLLTVTMWGLFFSLQEEGEVKSLGASAGTASKLPKEVQDLIKMIFDVETMKKAMMEFEVCFHLGPFTHCDF